MNLERLIPLAYAKTVGKPLSIAKCIINEVYIECKDLFYVGRRPKSYNKSRGVPTRKVGV